MRAIFVESAIFLELERFKIFSINSVEWSSLPLKSPPFAESSLDFFQITPLLDAIK